MIDLDRYVLHPCMASWGRPVTYYSSTDPPLVLLAVFDDKYREETLQSMTGVVVGARPMLGLGAASLPGGRIPAQGELFAVDGRLYAVSDPTGMATSRCRCGSRPTRKHSGSHDAVGD